MRHPSALYNQRPHLLAIKHRMLIQLPGDIQDFSFVREYGRRRLYLCLLDRRVLQSARAGSSASPRLGTRADRPRIVSHEWCVAC